MWFMGFFINIINIYERKFKIFRMDFIWFLFCWYMILILMKVIKVCLILNCGEDLYMLCIFLCFFDNKILFKINGYYYSILV